MLETLLQQSRPPTAPVAPPVVPSTAVVAAPASADGPPSFNSERAMSGASSGGESSFAQVDEGAVRAEFLALQSGTKRLRLLKGKYMAQSGALIKLYKEGTRERTVVRDDCNARRQAGADAGRDHRRGGARHRDVRHHRLCAATTCGEHHQTTLRKIDSYGS